MAVGPGAAGIVETGAYLELQMEMVLVLCPVDRYLSNRGHKTHAGRDQSHQLVPGAVGGREVGDQLLYCH